jgi:hypothetical protein
MIKKAREEKVEKQEKTYKYKTDFSSGHIQAKMFIQWQTMIFRPKS